MSHVHAVLHNKSVTHINIENCNKM